jgi:hypothetical protein
MSQHSEKVPKAMAETFAAVTALTDGYCQAHLNAEYAQLMRFAAAALCRKRPSPLASGATATWAAGIAHAVGTTNFVFDSSQTPHVKAPELYAAFGVAPGTAQGKSKKIRDLLGMQQLGFAWSLPSRMQDLTSAWLFQTSSGFIVDARDLSRAEQVRLHEAGLIPYIPADRTAQ